MKAFEVSERCANNIFSEGWIGIIKQSGESYLFLKAFLHIDFFSILIPSSIDLSYWRGKSNEASKTQKLSLGNKLQLACK